MKMVKRMLCSVLGMVMAFSAFHTAVFAVPAGEAQISGVTFMSNGAKIRKLPSVGSTVSAEVITDADTLALVLAAYDKRGRVLSAAVGDKNGTGTVTMTGKVDAIRLFAWSDMKQLSPVTERVYTLTNSELPEGILRGFFVNGIPAEFEGNTVTAKVPVWDKNGNANTQWNVKAITQGGTGTVSVDSVTLNHDAEQTMALSPARLTATENGVTEEYRLNIMYIITEDFDTSEVFDDSYQLTGSPTVANSWAQAGIIGGNLAQNTFMLNIGGTGGTHLQTQAPNIRAGVLPISKATKTNGVTPMDINETGASGKALRVGKASSVDNATDCGYSAFVINNAMFGDTDMPLTVEYDLAVDYSKVTAGIIGLNGGGIRYNSNQRYSIYDAFQSEMQLPKENEATLQLLTYDGKTNVLTDTGAKINRWHHVKQVFDKKNNTATTYVDDVAYQPDYDLTQAGGYQDSLNLWFLTSGRRCADIWLDNLEITWGKEYSGTLQGELGLVSMNVAGANADIDSTNNIVDLKIPLWDANGEAINLAAVPVTLNGSGTIKVGDTVVNSSIETTLDLSTAKQITVSSDAGQKVYDMTISRVIYDNFDNNTVFTGEITGSDTKANSWENDAKVIKGSKANSVMQVNLASGGSDLTYQKDISVGVAEITAARGLNGNVLSVGPSSGASGKALRISKKSSVDGADSGQPIFTINSNDFKDANTTIVLEYDLAFDYNNVTKGNRGMLSAGALYNGSQAYYISDNGINKPALPTDARPRFYFGTDVNTSTPAGAFMTLMNVPLNAWMHVKIELDVVSKKAATTLTVLNTDTNEEEFRSQTGYVLDGGTGTNNGNSYQRATWCDTLNYTFRLSSRRSADLWVDNLSITYDVSTTK